MKKILELHKHFVNWYVRIFERLGILQGDVTYITRTPRLSFTFQPKSLGTPLWILEDMLYHDPYNDGDFVLGEKPIIVDLGANLGFFSVTEAKRFPKARIFAYEAHPVNHKYLVRNVAQNAVEGQVVALHAAVVGEPRETVSIFENDDDVGSHSLIKDKKGMGSASHEVPAITFNDVLRTQRLQHVDLLKMDIEGGEYDIVRHSKETLQKVRYMALEHHIIPGERVEDLKEMITSYGFEVREYSPHVWHCVNRTFVTK